MGILENIKVAFEGLRLNKMRSFLTMLGIIIGISSVIGIATIGKALSDSVAKGFDSIGNNAINISIRPKDGQSYDSIIYSDYITDNIINAYKERFKDEIDTVVLNGPYSSGTVSVGKKSVNLSIESTTDGAQKISKLKMMTGRFLNDEDVTKNRHIGVISDKAAKDIYGDVSKALGSEININTPEYGLRTYTIIGVYKYEPVSFGVLGGQSNDEPTSFYIPYSVGISEFGYFDYRNFSFQILAADGYNSSEVAKNAENFINDNFYADNNRAKVESQTVESVISEVNSVMGTIKLGIGAIAAISLIVGGIGVMNILLVSVTERTREIGVRKALGATNKDIRLQFIVESIIICVIGGIIGIIFGTVIGYTASIFMKSKTFPSLLSIIVAVGFSMFIGIFFGYYPANKAAKLNPIDALRYE